MIIFSPLSFPPFLPGPLPTDVTHIITESKELSSKQLKKKLNCEEISSNVFIVHISWLIDCVKNSSHLEESSYSVKISGDETGPLPGLGSGSGTPGVKRNMSEKTISTNIDDSTSHKKAKSSDDDLSSSEEKNINKYPIIPNPILFPDFVPIYGSWQEYRSVMYKFNKPSEKGLQKLVLVLKLSFVILFHYNYRFIFIFIFIFITILIFTSIFIFIFIFIYEFMCMFLLIFTYF